jgi:hypothetical protein
MFRDIQPLGRGRRSAGVVALVFVLFHISRFIFLVATTRGGFGTWQALGLYGVNHGSI